MDLSTKNDVTYELIINDGFGLYRFIITNASGDKSPRAIAIEMSAYLDATGCYFLGQEENMLK